MSRFLRGWAILWVVFRYGLDELVLSGIPHPRLRSLRGVLTFGRKLDKPRGVRLREALEVIKTPNVVLETNAVHTPGLLRPVGDENFTHIIMPINTAR